MRRFLYVLPVLAAVAGAVTLGTQSQEGPATAYEEIEFADARVYFEYNATDLDLGIHLGFDAEGWEKVDVRGPRNTTFTVKNGGALNDLGSTEVFTESAEPPLDEENLEAEIAAFLANFPAGTYRFEGRTINGDRLVGEADLSHALVAKPVLIFPDEDAEENLADPEDTVILWADGSEEGDPEVTRYEVVVEFEDEETEAVYVLTHQIPVNDETEVYEFEVPAGWFEALEELDGEFKAEVVAIAGTLNATISEAEFELEDDEEEEE